MKKINIKKLLGLFTMATIMSLTSCSEDVEVWDSETLEYSGTYFFELYDEDMTTQYTSYDHSVQLMIYNTADNIENTVWLDDAQSMFPLKSKFLFTGTSESFMSENTAFDDLDNDVLAIAAPGSKPTGLGEEITEERYYIRNLVLDGKILPNAGTTVSGNPVDSIYIKIKLLSGNVKFTSYEVDESLRANPEVAEYDWEYDSATYDDTLDETYVISGHRKTGFAEDDH